jgi:phage terminase large subunit-like protein
MARSATLKAVELIRELKLRSEKAKYDWFSIARENQILPDGFDWVYWLILAGRGFGKTRTGAETVRHWVMRKRYLYVNLIGATADDARDIMIEGESGILAICPRDDRPVYKKSERKLIWPNGHVSLIFTADEPDRLRGKQHSHLWADELAAWRYEDAWDQAQFGLRLGLHPQAVITTTPRPTKIVKEIAAGDSTIITKGTTYDNEKNLAPSFYKQIITKYEGTRLGRQELNAEILDDNPNALWKREWIEKNRVHVMPDLIRIVVGVDPAVSSKEDSDETGIVTVGMLRDNAGLEHYYVLADDTQTAVTPATWGKRVVKTYIDHKADRVIGEVNQGGEMVELTIKSVEMDDGQYTGKDVAYKGVHASRAKVTRAEPVSALYEQGRVHHVGTFSKLEDQMCDYDPLVSKKSPDRMDALVWAITELMDASGGGIHEYYRRLAKEKKGIEKK